MKKLIVFLILFVSLFVARTDAAKLRENGATSVIEYFVFRDKTTGVIDTGVTIANIDTYYIEEGALISSKTDIAAHAAGDDAWDATEQGYHMGYGVYRIDWENAAFDGGVGTSVQLIAFDGDGGAFAEVMEIQLSAPVDSVLVVGATPLSAANIEAEALDALQSTNLDHLIPVAGAVETSGSNSTTQVQTDLAEATNDHYDVMTILFTSNAEAGQSRLITGYTGSSGTVSWNAALTGTPADGSTFIILAAGTTADAVWDEILTGSSHNISTSAGKRLRQIEEAFVHANGTIATVTNGHTFTLDAGAVATADYYIGDRLQLVEGTGAGQSRIIVAYTSGKVVTLDSNFTTNPNTSTLYEINAADVHVSLSDADQAQGFVATYTNTTTITLDAGAVATTNYYLGSLINFTHGTGAGQVRKITGYTNGRVVTMAPALAAAVDTTTVWHVQAASSVSAAAISDAVWDEAGADHNTFGTSGWLLNLIKDLTF